jgi:ABC-2 type transport system permease protein
MELLKYYHIAKINFKNSFVYIPDSIASSMFIAFITFIFANIWRVVFSANGTQLINGFTFPMMIWYLVMTESIITSQGKIISQIGQEIIRGDIANYLNKPYNYLIYKYASTIGASTASFFITIICAGTVALIMVGPLNFDLTIIPFVLISAFLGITLHFTMMSTLGILALWLEDARSLEFLYQKILFVAGGMLVPLDVFPLWFSSICILLPFSYAAYYPAVLLVNFSFNRFIQTIIAQIFWIIVSSLLALFLFNILSKRVSINGG